MSSHRHARIKELFLAVYDLPEEQRASRLAALCGGDTDLQREVERLLEHHEADPQSSGPLRCLRAALEGRYEVESEIGRGGMAAVYLAEDLKHGRKVAVKVLHPELAMAVGPERFLQEIRISAGLSHPHILPVFDSGEADGLLFFVMPFMSGESLADRLGRAGRLSIDAAVRITREVADALDFAHARGIVHRDVKPSNILLEAEHAILADFGIARAVQEVGGLRLTAQGSSPGTPLYMSPEQASGATDLDGRTDLYSLGCSLYEMLTGQVPFNGATPEAILARKMARKLTSVRALRSEVPPRVEAALSRALAREREERFPSGAAFAAALAGDPAKKALAGQSPRAWGWLGRLWVGAGVLAAVLVGAFLGRGAFHGSTATPPPARSVQITTEGNVLQSAVSPDGRYVAYSVPDPAPAGRTMVRAVGSAAPRTLLSRAAHSIEWSQDGSEILLGDPAPLAEGPAFAAPKTVVVPLVGQEDVARLVANDDFRKWSPDQSRLLGWDPPGRIIIRTLTTGSTDTLQLQTPIEFLHDVDWSPDGRFLAFVALSSPVESLVGTLDLTHRVEHILLRDTTAIHAVRWSDNGREILYFQEREIWQLPVDPSGSRRGPSEFVVGELTTFPRNADLVVPTFTLTADGRRVGYTRFLSHQNLWLHSRSNSSAGWDEGTRLVSGTGVQARPSLSPDGRLVAYSDGVGVGEGRDIFLLDLQTGGVRQLTFSEAIEENPVWSPSGDEIAFASSLGSENRLWVVGVDGTAPHPLGQVPLSSDRYLSWAPGEMILAQAPGNVNFVVVDPLTGSSTALVQGEPPGWMFHARFAPDGHLVAVRWNRPGTADDGLWIVDLEDGSVQRIAAVPHHPYVWSADGNEVIAFHPDSGDLLSIPVDGSDPRALSKPPCPPLMQLTFDSTLSTVVCPKDVTFRDAVMVDLDPGAPTSTQRR